SGEAFGQRLDQVERLPLDHCDQPVGQRTVVDGTQQVVSGRGRPEVEAERDVDDELLAKLALGRQAAMPPAGTQPAQHYPVCPVARPAAAHSSSSSSWLFSTGEPWCSHIRQPASVRRNALVVTTLPPAVNVLADSSVAVMMFSEQVITAWSPE